MVSINLCYLMLDISVYERYTIALDKLCNVHVKYTRNNGFEQDL